MKWIAALAIVLIVTVLLLRAWRYLDERALARVWEALVEHAGPAPQAFDASLVADLPEPARRFFEASIEPGTPLHDVAEISMHGELSLGTRDKPAYQPLQACQLLAPPHGFIWQVRSGRGLMQFTGSDAAFPGGSWTRFWLAGLAPVARRGSNPDHALSSFGRYMAEAIIWTPAALLPSANVAWQALDEQTARVTVQRDGQTQAFDVSVDADGRLLQVS